MSASMYRLNTKTTLHIFYLLIFLDSGQVGCEIIRAILVRHSHSEHALNRLTLLTLTIELGKLFEMSAMLTAKEYIHLS